MAYKISDVDRLILTHLSQLKQQLTRLTESVSLILQSRAQSDAAACGLPQGLTLPLDSVAEINDVELKLQQATFRGQLVSMVPIKLNFVLNFFRYSHFHFFGRLFLAQQIAFSFE